jgi:hypothetical protein
MWTWNSRRRILVGGHVRLLVQLLREMVHQCVQHRVHLLALQRQDLRERKSDKSMKLAQSLAELNHKFVVHRLQLVELQQRHVRPL